jgi:lipooligosaccharide transport system permease protein
MAPAAAAQAGQAWRPASVSLALRETRFWLTNYRHTWRGSIYTSVLNPVLYLTAMGLGLGKLVDAHGLARLGGVSYLSFLAPGLLAAAAMQSGLSQSTFPVLGSVKWRKTYYAAAATPMRPADIFHGHLLFTAARLAMNATIFLAVMAAFGAVHSAWAPAMIGVGTLTGLAFAAPLEAWSVTLTGTQSFALVFRFGMIPLFLFSGTFFPVTQLPAWARFIAYATPLWHGVALCRALSLGTVTPGAALGHVGYLAALAAVGVAVGNRTYRRRLYV